MANVIQTGMIIFPRCGHCDSEDVGHVKSETFFRDGKIRVHEKRTMHCRACGKKFAIRLTVELCETAKQHGANGRG